jgi:hypothetical protein
MVTAPPNFAVAHFAFAYNISAHFAKGKGFLRT